MNILSPFKEIKKTNVLMYVEAFGDDDYETRHKKLSVINKVKEDKEVLKRKNFNSYYDYEKMLKEKYTGYKRSLGIEGRIGDEGGDGMPRWFKNAVKYNGQFVTYNGELVTYSG